jgi:hypothetical protein
MKGFCGSQCMRDYEWNEEVEALQAELIRERGKVGKLTIELLNIKDDLKKELSNAN